MAQALTALEEVAQKEKSGERAFGILTTTVYTFINYFQRQDWWIDFSLHKEKI